MSDPVTAPTAEKPSTNLVRRPRFLPPVASRGYHLLLGAVDILILGPLGGITAAFMNFSVGFFVGGQVLAGILGIAVTFGYGSEGKHAANYIQTMAASVAGMCGMAVLAQGMVWLGLTDFLLDAVFLSSPYASSFGGFVELPSVLWWTAGGVLASLYNGLMPALSARRAKSSREQGSADSAGDPGVAEALPSDMSTTSLVGGGLIAGDSLAALSVGIYGLLHTVL